MIRFQQFQGSLYSIYSNQFPQSQSSKNMETPSEFSLKRAVKLKVPTVPKSKSNQQVENTGALAPIKLNVRKFPENFFGKIARSNSNSKYQKSHNLENRNNNTQRKGYLVGQFLERSENALPEAEITSFFKMADILTTETTLPDSINFSSSRNLESKTYDVRERNTSIQLSRSQNLHNEELFSCTFAKKTDKDEKVLTPTKQKQIFPDGDEIMTQKRGKERAVRRQENRIPSISSHSRRKSMSKDKTARKQIKMKQELLLPPIH